MYRTGCSTTFGSGLVLFSNGFSVVLPNLAFPRSTVEGVVADFHEVAEYRARILNFESMEPADRADFYARILSRRGSTPAIPLCLTAAEWRRYI
jgi:hypothetical protein